MEPYDRNTPYNALPPLPPEKELYMDDDVLKKLVAASRRLSELKGLASALPNQSIFVNTIALREAKASSAIENIFTTDDELYKSLSYQEDDYLEGPAKEILHYREALWKGFQGIAKENAMTIDTIVNVYRIVKNSMDGIRPYQAEIVIKKRGWGSLIADTVYTPPRGKGIVEKKRGGNPSVQRRQWQNRKNSLYPVSYSEENTGSSYTIPQFLYSSEQRCLLPSIKRCYWYARLEEFCLVHARLSFPNCRIYNGQDSQNQVSY